MTLKIELDLRPLKLGVGEAMNHWLLNAKAICPKDTEVMKNSIKVKVEVVDNGFIGIIGTKHDIIRKGGNLKKNPKGFHYPFAVHNGRKAFTLQPGSKGFLAFQVNMRMRFMGKGGKRLKKAVTEGDWVFTKKPIKIPAMKARPFFIWSYENMRDKMNKAILDWVRLK
jgi:hypothetical protein